MKFDGVAISRRRLLRNTAMFAGAGLVGSGLAWSDEPTSAWRTFELTTRVETPRADGVTRVWVPLPLQSDSVFQQCLGNAVQCDGGRWSKTSSALGVEAAMVTAEFPHGVTPLLHVTSRVRLRDWTVDLQHPKRVQPLPLAERQAFLRSTEYVPTDGVVRAKAREITRTAATDEDKARAIYEWIVANMYRKSSVRGCGRGSIRPLLETGDLGGKCADISAVYAGLARAVGLPARDVYGIRVAPSRLGYRSLGPATSVVSKAQHCRTEVWLERFSWVPLDPADVLKVMLEEPPGHLAADDAKVQAARQRLFGSWEMNWIAYNYAQDVVLPGSQQDALPFFMYPQAETAEGRLDSLDPDAFRYEVTATEV